MLKPIGSASSSVLQRHQRGGMRAGELPRRRDGTIEQPAPLAARSPRTASTRSRRSEAQFATQADHSSILGLARPTIAALRDALVRLQQMHPHPLRKGGDDRLTAHAVAVPSRRGLNVATPNWEGATASTPPLTPLFAGSPTRRSHSPEKSYMPQLDIIDSTSRATRSVTTRHRDRVHPAEGERAP